jgi:UDP-glucose 4-epimerase
LEADLTQSTSIENALQGLKFDYVVHTASLDHSFLPDYPRLAYETNVIGSLNLVRALAHALPQRLLYTSTYAIYGNESVGLNGFSEADCPNPASHYAASKLAAEYTLKLETKKLGISLTITRLTNCYGAPLALSFPKSYTLLPDLCRMVVQEGVIRVKSPGNIYLDMLWAGDAASAICDLLLLPGLGTECYNIGAGVSFSLQEIALLVQNVANEKLGKTTRIEFLSPLEVPEPKQRTVKLNKITDALPLYAATNRLKQEIANLLDWYSAAPQSS